MENNKRGWSSSKGFTLIEIVIVIVIVSLLALALIKILRPDYQMKLAQDGVVIATINEIVISTDSFISSYGRVPKENEFFSYLEDEISNSLEGECSYSLVPNYECLFSLEGINISRNCDQSRWTGTFADNEKCYFRYQGNIRGNLKRYRIYVRSHALTDSLLVYDNKEGGQIYECPTSISDFNSLSSECRGR